MEFDGFDWDTGNLAKCEKHRLTREEIEAVFLAGPIAINCYQQTCLRCLYVSRDKWTNPHPPDQCEADAPKGDCAL
jgi:hypothetical protein